MVGRISLILSAFHLMRFSFSNVTAIPKHLNAVPFFKFTSVEKTRAYYLTLSAYIFRQTVLLVHTAFPVLFFVAFMFLLNTLT